MRNSQDKLYNFLAYHGITAEEVYRVILENSDKQLIKEIMNLRKTKNALEKRLENPKLSPKQRQYLDNSFSLKSQQYAEKWDEIKNSPNKDKLLEMFERANEKNAQKSRTHDKTLDHDRTR